MVVVVVALADGDLMPGEDHDVLLFLRHGVPRRNGVREDLLDVAAADRKLEVLPRQRHQVDARHGLEHRPPRVHPLADAGLPAAVGVERLEPEEAEVDVLLQDVGRDHGALSEQAGRLAADREPLGLRGELRRHPVGDERHLPPQLAVRADAVADHALLLLHLALRLGGGALRRLEHAKGARRFLDLAAEVLVVVADAVRSHLRHLDHVPRTRGSQH